jgi:serine protease Do
MGTAFYVHPNILATSYHVIQGATTITAVRDTTRVRITSLLAFDPKRDVALLYTPLEGPALPLGWEDLEPFAQVQALGFVSEGSVQKIPAVFMAWEQIAGIWHMRLQGPVQPGMSGGPVLNREGRVVGLNRFTAAPDTPSAAVAVGVRAVRRLLDRSLAEPEFMDLAAFARKTGNRPKLQTRDNRLLITDQ